MGYVTMSKPTQGTATLKSQIDQLIDNDEALNDAVGVGSGVVNGSFETGSGADAPTGWTRTTWGTAAYDTTTPAHGAQAYKFTSTGSGGGTLLSEDFIECSEYMPITLAWLLKSSVADIKNIVTLKFYDSAQSAVSDVVLYSDDTTNPTSWTRFVRGCVAPATARYMKILLTFADSSDATSGTCFMDGVEFINDGIVRTRDSIAEATETHHSGWWDHGSITIPIPGIADNNTHIRFLIQFWAKCVSTGCYVRFRIGTTYSAQYTIDGTATYTPFLLDWYPHPEANLLEAEGQSVTIVMQLQDGGSSTTAKVDPGGFSYMILNA